MHSENTFDGWEEATKTGSSHVWQLVVDIDGFEGPLDLLLTLCRSQKVDLLKVSILQLVDQYLDFIEKAKELQLELAADYLVMAAWLAFLKSRILLPTDLEEGPSGEELAAYLAFQLERLSAMRNAAVKLMVTDRLGKNFFYRGMPERITKTKNIKYDTNLLDLVQAYARVRTKDEFRPYVLDRAKIYSMEEALGHLRKFLNFSGDWTELSSYLPEGWVADPEKIRSATASTFAACLELTKVGEIELTQAKMFAPINIRKK